QLVAPLLDGFLELKVVAAHVHRDLLRQVAVGHRDGHLGEIPDLRRQVGGHRVDALGEVLPHAGHLAHLGLAAELALGANLARDARHLGGEHAELLDHGVDDGGGAQELALERAASTSSGTVCRRSPWATAASARVTSVVGHSRSSINVLTEVSISAQAPRVRPNLTRLRVLPSRPTAAPTRSSCCAMRWLAATISLKVSAILPAMPMRSLGRRTEKSPTRMAVRAWSSSCTSTVSPLTARWASPLLGAGPGRWFFACFTRALFGSMGGSSRA